MNSWNKNSSAVLLFNNLEEVKVWFRCEARVLMNNEVRAACWIQNWVRLYRRVRRTKGVGRGQAWVHL